jgi:hypothetical protein
MSVYPEWASEPRAARWPRPRKDLPNCFWNNPFGNSCQKCAERHFLSRWTLYGECTAKVACPELQRLVTTDRHESGLRDTLAWSRGRVQQIEDGLPDAEADVAEGGAGQ